MAVVKVYENGNKFNFNSIKVGDIVVITSTEYSFSNNSEMWPKRSYFQLNKVTAVGEDYVEVENKYKFKQAIKYTYYIPLVVNTEKEIEYTDEYLKITRCPDYIKPLDGKTYNNEYSYGKVYEDRDGVSSPRYLFPYTEEWEKIIKECEYYTAQRKKEEEQKKIKEQQLVEMKKESKEQYDAVIDPLVRKLEELKKTIFNERCKAFDKFYCSICKNNDNYCKYEIKEYGWSYCGKIDSKTHLDKDGWRYRPMEDCKYFEKEEGK